MSKRFILGILGAGKVGTALARLAADAGYEVLISNSGDPKDLALTVEVMTPGAKAAWSSEVIDAADVIILALPLSQYSSLSPDELRGKTIIDATNHWPDTDGIRPEFSSENANTSLLVQEHLSESFVVKAFNHIGYHDLEEEAISSNPNGKTAVAIAGDDTDARTHVKEIIHAMGFDVLSLGDLRSGIILQPGHRGFGAALNLADLTVLLKGVEA